MRLPIAVALLLASGVTAAQGQPGGSPNPKEENIEVELLELEQDVDKNLYREGLMLQGRLTLQPGNPQSMSEEMQRQHETRIERLKDFLAGKREAIRRRSETLKSLRKEEIQARMSRSPRPGPAPTPDQNDPQLIAERENAKVEVQLLQSQMQIYQQPLNNAMNALAQAEVAASRDVSLRGKAEAARKEFDEIKAKYVDFSKRFQLQQESLNDLQRMTGQGGMGGGFR